MNKEEIYYKLRLIREAENAIIREYPSNDIKTPCHLAIGAEAIAVAVCQSFPGAKIFASYRNHHWYLAAGGSLENFFLELYGKKNDIADGKAGSMHLACPEQGLMLTSAVVASQIGPAVGHAFAMKYQGKDTLTICAMGDGATEEGVFYECLNLAKLHNLKILFVVEDNLLAIHQRKKDRQAFRLAAITAAYGIPYQKGKAYSYSDAATAVTTADVSVSAGYPGILHLFYHRFMEHVGITEDYVAGYREKPGNLEELDSVERYARKLEGKTSAFIENRVRDEINAAVEKAKAAPLVSVESLLDHVFAP